MVQHGERPPRVGSVPAEPERVGAERRSHVLDVRVVHPEPSCRLAQRQALAGDVQYPAVDLEPRVRPALAPDGDVPGHRAHAVAEPVGDHGLADAQRDREGRAVQARFTQRLDRLRGDGARRAVANG